MKCPQCDYVTHTKSNLRSHMVRHSDVCKYSCSTCGQKFKCSTSLKMHSYSHKESSFECSICGKFFSRPQGLKIHYNTVHMQQKTTCPLCNEPFATRSSMNTHVKVQHKGLRFFCKCGKYFDRRTAYKKHGDSCQLAKHTEPELKSILP